MHAHGTVTDPAEQDIVAFRYVSGPEPQAIPDDFIFPELDAQGHSVASHPPALADPAQMHANFDRHLAEESARSFAQGHARGIEEGRTAERDANQAAHSDEASARAAELASLTQQFAAERDGYLERVESEVVRLALAIAARILRREAQTDPLLLLGAVRVALGQLAGATRLHLRVPAAHASLWTDAVALLPARAARPEIISDEALRLGDCILESELGSVDLAVPAQLSEIERQLFSGATHPSSESTLEQPQP